MSIVQERCRRPLWWRIWNSLEPSTQQWCVSYSWAVSVVTVVVAILAFLTLSVPGMTRISLSASLSLDDGIDDSFSLEPMEEPQDDDEFEDELIVEEPPVIEPVDIDTPIPSVEPVIPAPDAALRAVSAVAADQEITASALGDLNTDAARIQETNRRIVAAGGSLNGPLRVSLSFTGNDDIDLHVIYDGYERRSRQRRRNRSPPNFLFAPPNLFGNPNGNVSSRVFYGNRRTPYATLDVDANVRRIHPFPAENVIFSKLPRNATYTVMVDHYRLRGRPEPTPYVVVVAKGKTKPKVYQGNIMPYERMKTICQFKYNRR